MTCIPWENEGLTCSSGSGMYMSWSRHPGLRMAGSMISGRLVAPMIKTFFLGAHPVHLCQDLVDHSVSSTTYTRQFYGISSRHYRKLCYADLL